MGFGVDGLGQVFGDRLAVPTARIFQAGQGFGIELHPE